MIIKYLGHSCFYIKSDKGTSLLTDPYKLSAYGGSLTYGMITDSADVVIVSHDHEDHADINGLPNEPLQIKTSSVAYGIDFDIIQTYHDASEGKERGKNRVSCFVIDDIRVCHLGDLGHVLSEAQVKEIGTVDVLLTPIGGTFTIGPDEATVNVELLKPKIVIPMHYRNEKCGFPILPVDPFLEGKSNVRRSPSSEVVLHKQDLPEQTAYLCIPPAN